MSYNVHKNYNNNNKITEENASIVVDKDKRERVSTLGAQQN